MNPPSLTFDRSNPEHPYLLVITEDDGCEAIQWLDDQQLADLITQGADARIYGHCVFWGHQPPAFWHDAPAEPHECVRCGTEIIADGDTFVEVATFETKTNMRPTGFTMHVKFGKGGDLPVVPPVGGTRSTRNLIDLGYRPFLMSQVLNQLIETLENTP